jgi:hypothetical protein
MTERIVAGADLVPDNAVALAAERRPAMAVQVPFGRCPVPVRLRASI